VNTYIYIYIYMCICIYMFIHMLVCVFSFWSRYSLHVKSVCCVGRCLCRAGVSIHRYISLCLYLCLQFGFLFLFFIASVHVCISCAYVCGCIHGRHVTIFVFFFHCGRLYWQHASDAPDSAQRELKLWLPRE